MIEVTPSPPEVTLPQVLYKIRRWFFLTLLYVFVAFSFTLKINLTTADLGRHIKNGEIFFELKKPIHTNFYSYTHPDFPTINHHWLTGVVFYLLYLAGGFSGLSIFYTALFLLTFFFFFKTAERLSNFHWAYFFSVLSLPLMTSREEIRPEGLSCFLLSVYIYLLYRFKNEELNFKWLLLIPLLQIFWVNVHIFFFMGFVVIGAFFLDAVFIRKDRDAALKIFWIGVLCLAAIFINPLGWQGAATPLTIFKEYGYMLAENQNIFFMHKRFPDNMEFIYPLVLLGVCALALTGIVFQKKSKEFFVLWILMGFFSLLALKAVRSISLFGFLFVPFGAAHFFGLLRDGPPGRRILISKCVFGLAVFFLLIGLISKNIFYSPYKKLSGVIPEIRKTDNWFFFLLTHPAKMLGLLRGNNAGAEFFKARKIKGPVFNDYDIGGYLIFNLFPGEHVFVDNRPEAYPASFFKEEYVPMQEDEKIWQEKNRKYHFNAIFFYWKDQTPWAQTFLIRRVKDPDWAPVFVDPYTLILLKRNDQNASLIRQYEVPGSTFNVIGRHE